MKAVDILNVWIEHKAGRASVELMNHGVHLAYNEIRCCQTALKRIADMTDMACLDTNRAVPWIGDMARAVLRGQSKAPGSSRPIAG